MGLLSRLFSWRAAREQGEPPAESPATRAKPSEHAIELPAEPFVFECQACGKVFEARRKRPACPECDSPDVALLSE